MIKTTARQGFLALACAAGLGTIGCNGDRPASPDGPSEQDRFVSQLAGVWAGTDNKTPFGPMPFALSFERQSDGSLHAHTANQSGLYVDLRFARDEGGAWRLTEEAAVPGRGMQKHTLAAVTLTKDLLIFRDIDAPDDLQVRIELDAAAMVFQVMWRGHEHVVFHLPRLEGAAADRVRQMLAGVPGP
jgi:hypothetical protein